MGSLTGARVSGAGGAETVVVVVGGGCEWEGVEESRRASVRRAASKPSRVGFSRLAGVCVRVARVDPLRRVDLPKEPFSSCCLWGCRGLRWSLC